MKSIVIFGATGDLCRRKLIPALHSLHKKGLLPDDLVITGASRTNHGKQSWDAWYDGNILFEDCFIYFG